MSRRISRLVALTAVLLVLFFLLRSQSRPLQQPEPITTTPSTETPPTPPQRQPPKNPKIKFRPSSYDWSKAEQFHPPKQIKPLPTGTPRALPQVQADPSAFTQSAATDERRTTVRNVFKRSYDAYKEYAWLDDELRPLSGTSKNPFGGWAATLVDSLDTMWIMDLKDEFVESAAAAAAIDWAKTEAGAANIFETTIRHLGGLLSAYELSQEPALLQKAIELGEMLYVGFDTPSRMPGFWLNFKEARKGTQVAGTSDPSANPASLCMEFTRLSQLTGDPKFYSATDAVTRFLEDTQNYTTLPGMWPVTLDFHKLTTPATTFTVGALADSLYEYLPKMHALMGGIDSTYENLYRTAIDVVEKHLLFRPMTPDQDDVLFSGDVHVSLKTKLNPISQHLTCFVGGMFGLGGRLFENERHVGIGNKLARSCGWAYSKFPTGLMPEVFTMMTCPSLEPCAWDEKAWKKTADQNLPKGFKNARDTRYILRPEAIESIFVLYRITGDSSLQDLAWDMFQSILAATETNLAWSAITDVTAKGRTTKADAMESFWMAETLKYFYLIFSPPDLISLDEYVFNTEAHPLLRAR